MATRRLRAGVLAAFLIAAAACGGKSLLAPGPLPAWLGALIQEIQARPVANPPASITQYTYKGAIVYYLSARCCDIPSVLYDADGAVLCQPDGGLDGRGDGRCPDFLTTRSDGRLIWQDPRR